MLLNKGYYEIEETLNVINGVLKTWLEHDNAQKIRIFTQSNGKGIELKDFSVYHPTDKPWLTEITLNTTFSVVYVQYTTEGDIIEADDINMLNEKAHEHSNKVFLDSLNQSRFDEKSEKDHTHSIEDIPDFPSAFPASDVYAWAKQIEKPKYMASEIEGVGDPAQLTNGQNIVEAVNKAFTQADDGKNIIKNAVIGKNVTVPENPTFRELSDCISSIQTGDDTSDATMDSPQLLSGYTGYARGAKVTGTMPINNVIQYSLPVNGTVYLPAGYYPEGGYITQSGVQVGTDTSDATLIGGDQIISGYTAYARGNKVTGTMPYYGVTQYNLPVNGTYYIPAGYHPGGGYVTQSGVQQLVTASGTAAISGNGTLTITTGLNKVYCVLLKGDSAYGVIAPSKYSTDNSYTLAVASRYVPTGYSDQIGYCAWNGFFGQPTTFSITNKKLYDAFMGATAGAGANTSWVAYGY